MAYDYDRNKTAGPPKAGELRKKLQTVIKTYKGIDDYLFAEMTKAGAQKALGVLATAERLSNGLREELEKVAKGR
jgi:hypothetical protein